MLTIDCHEVEPIKNELLVYVSDQVAAIPTLKHHEFTLSPVEEHEIIDKKVVITALKEFLDSSGETRTFAVMSISGKSIQRKPTPVAKMFTCTHCGFVTQYEVEHNNHVKIHYL